MSQHKFGRPKGDSFRNQPAVKTSGLITWPQSLERKHTAIGTAFNSGGRIYDAVYPSMSSDLYSASQSRLTATSAAAAKRQQRGRRTQRLRLNRTRFEDDLCPSVDALLA